MDRADIFRFYAATPVWFWPILWWSFRRLDALMAARVAAGESVLAEIFTNGRGGLRVRWIARAGSPATVWCAEGPGAHVLADLDLFAEAFAAAAGGWIARAGLRAPTRVPPAYPPFARLEPG